jgi:hypothetical protein
MNAGEAMNNVVINTEEKMSMMSGWVVNAGNSKVAWANDRLTAEVKLVVERDVLFYRQVVSYTTQVATVSLHGPTRRRLATHFWTTSLRSTIRIWSSKGAERTV